ncbi:hypothetical protein DM01DRAFT_266182 [Hesseltinella vesiculosa]|uniref:Uncharacterized protein n=1 Tax=Hesseltinella vesiculosa TaxID=101127 RepID=A0A1X2G848_9FUNG|nr:hypothetical protein DM01DRAFT_266182 [Hesseltinella vesiculosa]
MQPNQMWTLSTGKVVEKQLFEYGLTQGDEHLCHSFIMDPRDQSYVQDGVFTEEELQEMATFHLSDTGSLPIRLKNYLKKFDVDTVQKFRAVLYAPQPWQNDFNPATSFEFDWIHQTFLHFARLWENTGPKREYRNSWDSNRDWKFIRDIFDNLPFAGFIM